MQQILQSFVRRVVVARCSAQRPHDERTIEESAAFS